jgi:hypothetical protein
VRPGVARAVPPSPPTNGQSSGVPFDAGDERPHAPGPEPDWSESWAFDFRRDDGTVGELRLTYRPPAAIASWWTRLEAPDVGLVVVRDEEVPMPRRVDSLTVRGDGLWAELVCETPFEHWTIGLEAFGLRVDDPSDEVGERLPVGLDLEWEVAGATAPEDRGSGYVQQGTVHGELLIASQRIAFAGTGGREHRWGT